MQEHMLIEGIHEGLPKTKNKSKGKRKPEFQEVALLDHRPYKNQRRAPERHRASKRCRGGEVQYVWFNVILQCLVILLSKVFADHTVVDNIFNL